AVGTLRYLAFGEPAPASDDLAIPHDGEPAVRREGGVAAGAGELHAAAVPAERHELVAAIESDPLAVGRPGGVRAGCEAAVVEAVDANGVHDAVACERQ